MNLDLFFFLTEMSGTGHIKIEDQPPDGNAKRLRKESVVGYAKAVKSLQTIQVAALGNKNSPACGTFVENPH